MVDDTERTPLERKALEQAKWCLEDAKHRLVVQQMSKETGLISSEASSFDSLEDKEEYVGELLATHENALVMAGIGGDLETGPGVVIIFV